MKRAARIAQLKPSPIRILSEGAPPHAIPLGLGEPTWALPEPARRALAQQKGACAYGPNQGLPELRLAVAGWHGAHPEEVLITTGSQGALFSLFQAFLDPGDAVLVPDPGFPAYPALARLAGAEAVPYLLNPGDHFRLDADAFEAALAQAPKAKIAVVNVPSNPTGGGTRPSELARVADACEARGLLLISDEVYRDLYFGARPPTLREVSDHGVVVTSVSKGWGAPGLRVGWIIGDPEILAPARLVHSYAVTAASTESQRAATALVHESQVILSAARQEVRARWEALASALQHGLGIEAQPPDGAFYYWMPLPDHARRDPMAFCIHLRNERGVVVVPGHTFGEAGRPFLRLSFAAPPEQIALGILRMRPFWEAPE